MSRRHRRGQAAVGHGEEAARIRPANRGRRRGAPSALRPARAVAALGRAGAVAAAVGGGGGARMASWRGCVRPFHHEEDYQSRTLFTLDENNV